MHGWRTFQAWACMVLCWAVSATGPSPLQAQENNLQLDFRAGLGLNEAAQDYFLGTGASVRF